MGNDNNANRPKGWAYRQYEKRAGWTLNRLRMEIGLSVFINFLLWGNLFGIITGDGIFDMLKGLLFGSLIGLIAGAAVVISNVVRSKKSRAYIIETTEGYTDELVAELRKLEAVTPVCAATSAAVYNFRGEFNLAIENLRRVDPYSLYKNPNGAHTYFSELLTACLLAGDMEAAEQAYHNGFYYMKTYMNSPVNGECVTLAFAIYEYYKGHYDVSISLLDSAFKLLNKSFRPDLRLPDENLRSVLSYWMAKNRAAVGDKDAAAAMLKGCENYYCTPYYKEKIGELKREMKKSENKFSDCEFCVSETHVSDFADKTTQNII